MTILQISDTHNRHRLLTNLPTADVLVHCGDFTDMGTEEEALNFLNWLIEQPYRHKIFVTGNHDLCLWEAENIEDLPNNIHFLQDRGCEIEGVRFFGLAYNHQESIIPHGVDVLITHEPPAMILDKSNGIHWGNLSLRNKVLEVKPKLHFLATPMTHTAQSNKERLPFQMVPSLTTIISCVTLLCCIRFN